jgi:hypothetical protein
MLFAQPAIYPMALSQLVIRLRVATERFSSASRWGLDLEILKEKVYDVPALFITASMLLRSGMWKRYGVHCF